MAVPRRARWADRARARAAPRRRPRGLRDHRRPGEGDDVPVAVPAGAARAAGLPDRRRRGRRLDASTSWSSAPASRSWAPARRIDQAVFDRFAARLSYVHGRLRRPRHLRAGRRGDQGRRAPGVLPRDPALPVRHGGQGPRRGRPDRLGAGRGGEAVRARPGLGQARWRTSCTSTSTSPSCTGSTTTSGRWAWRRSSTCGSPTRCSSRSGTGTTSSACRSRWPRTSASRTAATSTIRSARCATSWSTT